MNIIEFEKSPHQLRMDPSPFLRGLPMGVRGIPGGISWEVKIEGQDDSVSMSRLASSIGTVPGDEFSLERERKRMRMAQGGPSSPGPRSRDGSLTAGSMSPATGAGNLPYGTPTAPGYAGMPGATQGMLPLGGDMSGTPSGMMGSAHAASRRGQSSSRTSHQGSPAPMKQPMPVMPTKLGPPIPLPAGSHIAAKTLPDLFGSVDQLNQWCDVEPLPTQSCESTSQCRSWNR